MGICRWCVQGFARAIALAVVAAAVLMGVTPGAKAQVVSVQPREDVVLSITRTTSVGQSVFVLGNLPELGGNDVTRAVKLAPTAYPLWRATVSLPANVSYSYRYLVRDDGPGRTSDPTNAVFITPSTPGSTQAQPLAVPSKSLILTWDVDRPVLYWRPVGVGPFARLDMTPIDTGVSPRAGERHWLAWGFASGGTRYEFYFTGADGVSARYPATGQYVTGLDGVFVQDGQQYTYVPASAGVATNPAPARRDYSPTSVPTLFSPQLGETRGYRVFLPRGYDQHPQRRYPVLYMHDGQNVFESGAFGSWNAAATITALQASGQMREVIVVGLDNGPSRLTDYLPPGDFLTGAGRADRYGQYIRDSVKPLIDSTYRTMPGADVTGALGSSMGGVVSLYLGWDFTSTFTRVGLMSGAWQTCPNFLNRVRGTAGGPARNLTIFIDSGDSGTASDNYWLSYNLRDWFNDQASPRYPVGRSLRHIVGYGQQHNEAAWTLRLPDALTFLYPSADGENEVLTRTFGGQWDVDMDARVGVDDLYAQGQVPRDLDLSGAVGPGEVRFLEGFLRRGEARAMGSGQGR
jgi:predicted alpha/beta superfamily hydrolase